MNQIHIAYLTIGAERARQLNDNGKRDMSPRAEVAHFEYLEKIFEFGKIVTVAETCLTNRIGHTTEHNPSKFAARVVEPLGEKLGSLIVANKHTEKPVLNSLHAILIQAGYETRDVISAMDAVLNELDT